MKLIKSSIILDERAPVVANYLNPQDAKDDEESTADEDNVPNGSKRSDECLHHQLQPWGSADHPGNNSI